MDYDTSTLITMCNSKIVALFSLDTIWSQTTYQKTI